MNVHSLRFRLTAWYTTITLATVCLMGGLTWLSLRIGLDDGIAEELAVRAEAMKQMFFEEIAGRPLEEQKQTLSRFAEIEMGRRLLRVVDRDGRLLFASRRVEDIDSLPMPPVDPPPLVHKLRDYRRASTPDHDFMLLAFRLEARGDVWIVQLGSRFDDYERAVLGFTWTLLSLLPIAVLFAAFGGYWMSRRALSPVDDMIDAALSIGSADLQKGLAVPQSGDELQRLAETLNGMMLRLDAAFHRITQFTADASHELRTPVTIMRTTAELSLRKPRTDIEYRQALTQILTELERTTKLVDDLMLLARSDTAAVFLEMRPFDLVDSATAACEEGRVLAEAKGILLRLELPEEAISVEGDMHALRRVFLILIDNAVKYTPEGGAVRVSLAAERGRAVARVVDTGPGVPAEDLPHVFERFYRVDRARSRSQKSIGLGLSIAKWIVEEHGGEIRAFSALGEGAEFVVTLPSSGGVAENPVLGWKEEAPHQN